MLNKLRQRYQEYKKDREVQKDIHQKLENLTDPVLLDRILKHEDRHTIHSN